MRRCCAAAPIGMIGLGRIARATIELLRPFGVRIVAAVRSQREPPPGVTLVDFDQLLAQSDIVALLHRAVPQTGT